jgi:hypothetical protein
LEVWVPAGGFVLGAGAFILVLPGLRDPRARAARLSTRALDSRPAAAGVMWEARKS